MSAPRGGQALQLDDEYLQLRFSGGLGDVAEGFWDDSSVAYWVKYDGTASNTYNSLLTNSHNEYGNRLVNHLKGSAGTNRAFANLCGTGPGDSGCSGGPNDVAADTWAHLVYTSKMDGATRTDNFYVDGALTVTKTHNSILNGHQALKFGQARGNPYLSGHQQFHGELDQLEIWSHALSGGEVSAMHAAGPAGAIPEPSSLVLMLIIGHAVIVLRKRSM